MKERTDNEIKQIWREYTPLQKVDPFFLKVQRNCRFLTDLEGRVNTALARGNTEDNPLRKMVTDRDEYIGTDHTYQGTDVADYFWNLVNWNYFERQPTDKQVHLHRLAIVAGHFMDPEKMHPEMSNAVRYADGFV